MVLPCVVEGDTGDEGEEVDPLRLTRALAVAAYFPGTEPPPASLHNTCYSLVAADYGISVSMIYRVSDGAIAAVEGAGGLSALDADGRVRAAEARFARGWFDSIRADSFGV